MKKLSLLAILCMILLSCKNPFEPEDTSREIKYTITGTCTKADATYQFNGGTQQESSVTPGKWNKSYTAKKGDFIYISAQNHTSSGSITVNIYIGNKLYRTATSSGAFVIATASGRAE